MKKLKRCDGFLGCRTSKAIEEKIKALCTENNREVSEVINYMCRIFIEDFSGIRTKFFKREE
ncbi:MAG: hypothetical protein WC522_01080 [Candidatus Omnitrophota bacterium]